jgi:hypothetical protein
MAMRHRMDIVPSGARMNKEEREFAVLVAGLSLMAGFEGNIAAAALWNPAPLSSYQWVVTISSLLAFVLLFSGIILIGKRGLAKH